jgi:hypothetical protein
MNKRPLFAVGTALLLLICGNTLAFQESQDWYRQAVLSCLQEVDSASIRSCLNLTEYGFQLHGYLGG